MWEKNGSCLVALRKGGGTTDDRIKASRQMVVFSAALTTGIGECNVLSGEMRRKVLTG